jgi:hypothetical protein
VNQMALPELARIAENKELEASPKSANMKI